MHHVLMGRDTDKKELLSLVFDMANYVDLGIPKTIYYIRMTH